MGTEKLYTVLEGKNGNTIVKTASCYNHCPVMKKISKNAFVNTETGEINQTSRKSLLRGDNPISNRRSREALDDLIFLNIRKTDYVYYYCLTYSRKEVNLNKIYRNHNYFIEKLRGYSALEYIYVVEPYNNNDGYHIHGLLIAQSILPFSQSDFQHLWNRGSTDFKFCKYHKNIASYLTAHVTNSENTFARHLSDKAIANSYLPAYCNIVRHSSGIIKPKKTVLTQMQYENTVLSKIVPDYKRTFYQEKKVNNKTLLIEYNYFYYYADSISMESNYERKNLLFNYARRYGLFETSTQ